MFFKKKAVAVDIGSTSVKVVELSKSGDRVYLEKFAIEPVPQIDVKDENVLIRTKAEIVKKALTTANIKAKKCISSISGEKVLVRYIQMPKMPIEDLANSITWEAEEYIPFKIEDVNLDFVVLGDTVGAVEPKMDVLLVCAKKELVEERMSILQRAGLQAEIIDVDGFALVNCMEFNCAPQIKDAIAVINIGASKTNINIYFNKNIYFSRDISIGGNNITNAIVTGKGVNFNEAEEMKKTVELPVDNQTPSESIEEESEIFKSIKGTVEELTGEKIEGTSMKDDVAQLVVGSLNSLMTEIKRSIQFFENQMRETKVKKIYISGGTVNFKNFDKFMEKEIGINTEILNPFTNIVVSAEKEKILRQNNLIPSMGVVMGLGLRKVVD